MNENINKENEKNSGFGEALQLRSHTIIIYSKRKNQLYISLITCFCMENYLWKFQPKRTYISWDMNENINKENKKNSGFGEALQ